jgi:TolB-like protein/DNA-binding winged helix-turn-helix (wHTH) protein/cytochrome c-type biogenesis protein CcmH/NrfG
VATPAPAPSRLRFDSVEVDLRSGELWKNGARLRLQDQPFQLLRMLLEHPGELVTREQLRQRLWAADTFVDFDDGLNTAVKKLRDALGDSAEHPRYVETIPRHGYRFLAAVESEPTANDVTPGRQVRSANRHRLIVIAICFVAVAFALSAWLYRSRQVNRTAPVRAIAVLPLQNLSGDPSQDYFAAGLTDALTTELARAVGGSVRVTSRVSAEQYKNRPMEQTARELDVDAVVEGSVVRSGDRARITAQLIQARADKHLWAATYDRDLHDILGIEREIAATITRHVQIALSPGAQARLAAPVPIDPQAYDLYQRGRYRAFSNNPQELAEAISLLEQSVKLEPNFANAHALLARAYITQRFFARPEGEDLDAKALEELNHALKLDPDLADAYLARGMLYWTHHNGFPHERAIREIKHAIELDPNLAEAHHWLATVFMHVGLLDKAEQHLRIALRLEPTNVGFRYRIAVAQLQAGKAQDALTALEGTRTFAPDLWTYQMALALFQAGRKQETAKLIRDYLSANGLDQGGVGNAMQALLYGDAGETALAERSIEAAVQKGKDFGHFHHAAYTIGTAYALMDRPRDAVRWLRAAAEDGFPCYPFYEQDQSLARVRRDLEFQRLMADLKNRWEHYKAIS